MLPGPSSLSAALGLRPRRGPQPGISRAAQASELWSGPAGIRADQRADPRLSAACPRCYVVCAVTRGCGRRRFARDGCRRRGLEDLPGGCAGLRAAGVDDPAQPYWLSLAGVGCRGVQDTGHGLPQGLQAGDLVVDGEAVALDRLGVVQRTIGDDVAAVASHEHALRLCRETGCQQGEAGAHNRLGAVQFSRGEYQAAILRHEQALRLFREIGYRLGEAGALNWLRTAQQATGACGAGTGNELDVGAR